MVFSSMEFKGVVVEIRVVISFTFEIGWWTFWYNHFEGLKGYFSLELANGLLKLEV